MKISLLKWLPVIVIVTTVFNALSAYDVGNMMAVYGYITACCGWCVVALDSFATHRKCQPNAA